MCGRRVERNLGGWKSREKMGGCESLGGWRETGEEGREAPNKYPSASTHWLAAFYSEGEQCFAECKALAPLRNRLLFRKRTMLC